METRLESIMSEEGIAMEALLGGDGIADRPWRLNVSSFRLRDHLPNTTVDCAKKFGGEKGVDDYYKQQEEMLKSFVQMDSIADRGYMSTSTQEERDTTHRRERFAISVSNIANLIIFAAKVYACVKSGSLAIIASTLDSLLDLLSGLILWFAAISMRKQNPYLYPIGKKRMQPLVQYNSCL